MLTHLLLSLIGGTGILLITISITWRKRPSGIERLEALGKGEDGPLADETGELARFLKTVRETGLAAALNQAELPVTAERFIRLIFLLGVAGFMLTLIITGAIGVSVLAVFIGVILYIQWLIQKREASRLEYEEALGDLCDRLGVGAQLHGSLAGALTHAVETAPEILKHDFELVSGRLVSGATISEAFEALQIKRRSYALDLLVDTLKVWSSRGGTIPLHQILAPLSSTIREVAVERKRMSAELSGARDQMRIVAVAPLILVGLLRLSSPELASIYASTAGEVIQAVGYLIALAGYLLGTRVLSSVNQVIEFEGS